MRVLCFGKADWDGSNSLEQNGPDLESKCLICVNVVKGMCAVALYIQEREQTTQETLKSGFLVL
jgi:hypothetical protein